MTEQHMINAFNRICSKFQSGYVVGLENINNFQQAIFAELQKAYDDGMEDGRGDIVDQYDHS